MLCPDWDAGRIKSNLFVNRVLLFAHRGQRSWTANFRTFLSKESLMPLSELRVDTHSLVLTVRPAFYTRF